MPEHPTTAPEGFRASALTLSEVHLLRLSLDDTLPAIGGVPRYAFKTTANILFSQSQPELLRINLTLNLVARPAQGNGRGAPKARAQLVVAVVFHYAGLAALGQHAALPVELGWTAVSIAYSTVRGMVQARLAGTSFDRAILPIVSPQTLWSPPVSPAADPAD